MKPLPGNGLCFIVVDVAAFIPQTEFAALTEELRDYVKSCPPAVNHGEITLPGELDFRLLYERTVHGIPVDPQTLETNLSERRIGRSAVVRCFRCS